MTNQLNITDEELAIAVTDIYERITQLRNAIDKTELPVDTIITHILLDQCADCLKKSKHCIQR